MYEIDKPYIMLNEKKVSHTRLYSPQIYFYETQIQTRLNNNYLGIHIYVIKLFKRERK